MDKSEYNLKIEELKAAMHAHDFEKAVDVADSLDIGMLTVDSLGKNLCHTCFTSSSCSTKKIGMSDTVGINLIL